VHRDTGNLPANAVTIHNATVLPFANQFVEGTAGHSCYTMMLDLLVGYDHWMLRCRKCAVGCCEHAVECWERAVGRCGELYRYNQTLTTLLVLSR
jgi:hypothetical protein